MASPFMKVPTYILNFKNIVNSKLLLLLLVIKIYFRSTYYKQTSQRSLEMSCPTNKRFFHKIYIPPYNM